LRHFIALLTAILAMLPGTASATQQQNFWVWFQENRGFLESYAANTQAVTRALGARLQNVDRGLTYELGQAGDGVYEFIVSANGIRDVFPEVIRLVRVAPEIEGWRIIAFRPRRPDALTSRLDYAGMSISGEDIWYRSEDGGSEFNLSVYIRGLDPANERTAVGAAFLMLDLALGEYDVATKLRSIDFAPLPPDPAAQGLKPLNDLPREVDARFPASEN
jgi:hypothetical protein